MQEKRRAKRMDLQGTISIKALNGEEKNARIEILDVSRSGIGFICDENLELHSMYDTDLRLWTGDTLHAIIEVIRKDGDDDDMPSIYGGQFIGMPESDWCRIMVYETYQDMGE